MMRLTLAWSAFGNMLRAAVQDPIWAFVSLILAPFRIWKPLAGLVILLGLAAFVLGFGSRFALDRLGYGANVPAQVTFDLLTLLVLLVLAFRALTYPLIEHFGTLQDDTHGSARFATPREIAPLRRKPRPLGLCPMS